MKKIHNSLNTGDINLAASLMSIGIPLDQTRPCSLVLSDTGDTYARFHVMSQSVDGLKQTDNYFDCWRTPEKCRDTDFQSIMTFIKAGRKQGARYADEWFDYSIDYLADIGKLPKSYPSKIESIPDYVAKNPDGVASHLFAFSYNREHAWKLMSQARRRIMISRGDSHAMIDTHLEQWRQNELLARLEG